jgi:thiosulfate dehydrogenase (quinone) large subunit
VANGTDLSNKGAHLSGLQSFFLLFMRVVIGWHFLYEGYVKIASSGWSAAGYLNVVPGPFSGFFQKIVSNPSLLQACDILMKYGLAVIGLCLILGLFSRLAALGAVFMLAMFYLSNPPWLGVHSMGGEGSYLIVNKNLVELSAALVLASFPVGRILGFDSLFCKD